MQARTDMDVSVVLTFADDEEVVGKASRRVAEHLRSRGLSFELLAIDEDCGDNSHTVLSLVRTQVPELKVMASAVRGRGFARGSGHARGRALWLLDTRAAAGPLAPFGRAYRAVSRAERDAVVVTGRFAVCHRERCAAVLGATRGRGELFHRRLIGGMRRRGLDCDVLELRTSLTERSARRWERFLDALLAGRMSWTGPR
jgi:hypothetical protein